MQNQYMQNKITLIAFDESCPLPPSPNYLYDVKQIFWTKNLHILMSKFTETEHHIDTMYSLYSQHTYFHFLSPVTVLLKGS